MEKIVLVDEKDNIIGSAKRGTLVGEDIYRVTALLVENSKGQVLLAQRKLDKKNDPGLWGPSAAGTVAEGESYRSNVVKEASEELGLMEIDPEEGPKQRVRNPHNHFTQWFSLKIDKPLDYFKLQKEEVEQIKWVSKKKLIQRAQEDDPCLIYSLKDFILNLMDKDGA